MKISQILLVMVLSSIIIFDHFVDEDCSSNGSFNIAQIESVHKKEGLNLPFFIWAVNVPSFKMALW